VLPPLAAALGLLGLVLLCLPGVKFSGCLCIAAAGVLAIGLLLSRWAETSKIGRWCKRAFLVAVAALFAVLAVFEAAIVTRGEEDWPAQPVDAVIVLGAGVNGEEPSAALRTRIKAAADYMAQHPDVPVVLSGGQGPGEDISEAEAMRRALETGETAWDRRLLLEDRSTSTAENFAFSKEVLRQYGVDTDTAVIAVVTNDFHIFRAKLIARRQGLQTVGVPTELPWWWLTANYYLREPFALVKTLIFD
jgi:uncharacterized SAM-binding protein YcdF (DUF218 family)